jgi:murein DD-endopeptidase MepM/ murein hydrolase activator NlpD
MKRLLVLVIGIALLIPAGVAGAWDLNDDLASVNKRIDSLNNQIAAADSSRTSVITDIDATRDKLALRQAELADTQAQISDTQDQISDQERNLTLLKFQLQQSYQALADTRIRLDDSKQQAKDWIRAAYVGKNSGTEDVALTANSITSLYVSLSYLQYVAADNDRAMLQYESLQTQETRQQDLIHNDEDQVNAKIDELDATKATLDELAAEQTQLADEVAADLADLNAKLDSVEATIAEFKNELDGLQAEQARVEQLIEQEASREGERPSVLVRPVPGAITSGFGMRYHPILGYTRMHTGVDMHADYGTPIKAAASGRVIFAAVRGGYGNCIIIDHGGGMTTLYAHQSSFNVSYDDHVSAGEVIGFVGQSGLATGPHLHFEVRINGKPVDPAPYL